MKGNIFREVSIYIISTMLVSFFLKGLEGGHAHAPFSLFPEYYFIIAPLMPILSIVTANFAVFFQYISFYFYLTRGHRPHVLFCENSQLLPFYIGFHPRWKDNMYVLLLVFSLFAME